MSNVNITSKGIKRILKRYNAEQAIAEYIWNGFDARANTINIRYKANALGKLDFLEVNDNGYGIDFNELKSKFEPFYESEKTIEIAVPANTSVMHGKNGVGRMTFFTFAHDAAWLTTFSSPEGLRSGEIRMSAERLNHYEPSQLTVPMAEETGTSVTFRNLLISEAYMQDVVIPFLVEEFCWFLELNSPKEYRILINGEALDHTINIAEKESLIIPDETSDTVFRVVYIQWKKALHRELSKYYFIDSRYNEVYKDFTTLNKKADDFFHSVYITSDFFDDFSFKNGDNDQQEVLFGRSKAAPEYRHLIKELGKYIQARRRPYLRAFGAKMVDRFEADGIFPTYPNDSEKLRKPVLEEMLISLYEKEPKLFTNLNTDQRKLFVRMFDLLLISGEADKLVTLLEGITELDDEERIELTALFVKTA
ncbi:hypothetical protein GCM10023149_19490 [Mucilaginibacter gynuensis]|uniref:Histidine kinase/DNA gyrase B/HSP90-like ATPase n=1 Tax=Mucilaginibacter gynuensis TaxID=1302236 RepID=A0ABP8GAJ9_9SPHI